MANEQPEAFTVLLRQARRKAGLTQEALAERSGISTRAISDLERGINRTPRRDTLDMIARALDLPDEERNTWEQARRHLVVRSEPVDRSQQTTVHLPTPFTSFVGREHEIECVVDLLQDPNTRLLTLTGPGGVGKTRLSLAAAGRISDEHPHGVWFVDLAPLNSAELVLPTIATTLGLRVSGNQSVLAALTESLGNSHALLLLDNVEHVIESAIQIGELVRACPRLTILVTSRMPLHLSGEHQYLVSPMDLDAAETGMDTDDWQPEAVRLFVQRAQAVRPDFAVTEDSAQAVLAICRRLDGMPLAIELAAAHIRLLSPRAMLRRMDTSLPLLTGGARDLPLRQQTLRNTIAWSYDLLPPEIQQLFQRLSVFRGGWTLESAAAVTNDEQVMAGLEQLVEHNLVQVGEEPDGEPRYRMLETIREFGLQELAAGQQEHHVYAQHGRYFLSLAEDAIPFWRTFEHTHWYGPLETELDNLRAALAWFLEHDLLSACRLSGALWRFCLGLGNISEGRQWLEASLAKHPDPPPAVRARVLEGIGICAYLMSDYVVMRASYEQALPLWELVGDINGIAWAHHAFGRLTYETGDYALAVHHCNTSVTVSRQAGYLFGVAEALNVLGVIAAANDEVDRAQLLYEESLTLRREIGDPYGIQQSLSNLGLIAMRTGDLIRARSMFEQSLAIGRKYHIERIVESMELRNLGMLAVLQGEFQRARTLLTQSTTLFRQQGSAFWMTKCLMWFAILAIEEQQLTRAATISGTIDVIVEQRKMRIPPVELKEYDLAIANARRVLGDDVWLAAWTIGQSASLDEAINYAIGEDVIPD